MTVTECISLNSTASVVFFDNVFFKSSTMRCTMQQTSAFCCENKWRYKPDGCRISDTSALVWTLETMGAFSWQQRGSLCCFLVGYFTICEWLSVCKFEKDWEVYGDTEENHVTHCLLESFETESSGIPKRVFYHYAENVVVTACYTGNASVVQRGIKTK